MHSFLRWFCFFICVFSFFGSLIFVSFVRVQCCSHPVQTALDVVCVSCYCVTFPVSVLLTLLLVIVSLCCFNRIVVLHVVSCRDRQGFHDEIVQCF